MLVALSISAKLKMSTQPVKGIVRKVKPLICISKEESRRRVINLYKAWYRQLPDTVIDYGLPLTLTQARAKLKEAFMKNKHITDLRVIDMLVFKGQMDLKEVVLNWKQQCHIMYMVKDTQIPKQKDFLSKFLEGSD